MIDHFSDLSDAERSVAHMITQQVNMGDTSLRGLVSSLELSVPVCVIHEQGSSMFALELLGELTESGREDFSGLLDACVKEVRAGEDGLELVVDGVAPEVLERFCMAYETHEQA